MLQSVECVLARTARTKGYSGKAVEGVDIIMEMSGDSACAFLRVMPHAAEPERMKKNIATMQALKVRTLSEYQGKTLATGGRDCKLYLWDVAELLEWGKKSSP